MKHTPSTDINPMALPSMFFSDVADVDLNSNFYFDEQALQWALEVNFQDQWLFVCFCYTKNDVALKLESLTIADLQRLYAAHKV